MTNTIWFKKCLRTRSLSTWQRLIYELFYGTSSIYLPICGSALVKWLPTDHQIRKNDFN